MLDTEFAWEDTFQFSENAPAVQDIDNSVPQIKKAVLGALLTILTMKFIIKSTTLSFTQ